MKGLTIRAISGLQIITYNLLPNYKLKYKVALTRIIMVHQSNYFCLWECSVLHSKVINGKQGYITGIIWESTKICIFLKSGWINHVIFFNICHSLIFIDKNIYCFISSIRINNICNTCKCIVWPDIIIGIRMINYYFTAWQWDR